MSVGERQFSFTRAALTTGGRAKSKFSSVCSDPHMTPIPCPARHADADASLNAASEITWDESKTHKNSEI